MEDLIARLVEADGPSRELDLAIHESLGWKLIRFDPGDGDIQEYWSKPGTDEISAEQRRSKFAYTGSLDAQESLAHHDWQVSSGNCNEDNAPWACVTTPDSVDHTGDGAATEILARLIALLKATAALRARVQP